MAVRRFIANYGAGVKHVITNGWSGKKNVGDKNYPWGGRDLSSVTSVLKKRSPYVEVAMEFSQSLNGESSHLTGPRHRSYSVEGSRERIRSFLDKWERSLYSYSI